MQHHLATLLHQLAEFLRANPSADLFFCLTLGFALGGVSVGPIRLGGICGTLLSALAIGQVGVELSPMVKNFAFATFIFTLGFTAGPQLFANLDRSAWRIAALSVVEFVSVLAAVLVASWLLSLDAGSAAGLLAGGATESAVLGTASDALGHLPVPADEVRRLQSNIATVYSISYLCGLVTIVLFTSQVAPRLLRFDLRVEATKEWMRLGGTPDGRSPLSLLPTLVTRRYRVERRDRPTVDELEHAAEPPLTVESVARAHEELDVSPELHIEPDDDLLVVGQRSAVIRGTRGLGRELAWSAEGAFAPSVRDVVISKRTLHERPMWTLRSLLNDRGHSSLQVAQIKRSDADLPILPETRLRRGDVLRVVGDSAEIEHLSSRVGQLLPAAGLTDLGMLAVGVILGYLLGLPRLSFAGVEVALGTGGGALLSGLCFGWLQAKYQRLGPIAPAAASVLKDLGLATFIAAVGLASGTHALAVVEQYGWSLPVASVLVTLLPALVSLLLGHYVLKLTPPVLLGAVAGQQCSTPAINTLVSAAGNSTPMLGYTVTYALSNVLLPLLGPLVVALSRR
jgi:putative transport protein